MRGWCVLQLTVALGCAASSSACGRVGYQGRLADSEPNDADARVLDTATPTDARDARTTGDASCVDGSSSTCETFAEFVTVDAGAFAIGSPLTEVSRFGDDETLHPVELTRDFWFQTTEITQAQFEAATGWNPSRNAPCGGDCPLEFVSFSDLLAYANARSRMEGLAPCFALSDIACVDGTNVGTDDQGCMSPAREGIDSADVSLDSVSSVYDCDGYRLPTEAEWEVSARAGDPRATYNGELDPALLRVCDVANPTLDPIAWHCGNSGGETHPVAELDANAWGIFDTAGNAWEWAWDWSLMDNTTPTVDPEGPPTGSNRVIRGGSAENDAGHLRAANRWSRPPEFRSGRIGGRLARTRP